MSAHLRRLNYVLYPIKTTLLVPRRDIWNISRLLPISDYYENGAMDETLYYCTEKLEIKELSSICHRINILLFNESLARCTLAEYPELDCNFLVICQQIWPESVIEKLMEACKVTLESDLYETLMNALLNNSFKENAFIERLSRLSGNPILVLDTMMQPVMASSEDFMAVSGTDFENYNLESLIIKDECSVIKDANSQKMAVIPIGYENISIGYMVMYERNIIFEKIDEDYLRKIRKAIALEMQRAGIPYVSGEINMEGFFEKVLESEIFAPRYIRKTCVELGASSVFSPDKENYIICVRLTSEFSDFGMPMKRLLMQDINRILGGILWTIKTEQRNEFIVILFQGKEDETFPKEIGERLNVFLEKRGLYAGISAGFTGIDNIRNYYLQSRNAVMLFRPEGIRKNYVETPDHPFFDILAVVSGRALLHSYISHPIKKLLNYDKRFNTDFYSTLCVYLENCCNVKKTADQLFLHRNTMMYRVNRISEISGIDFNNYNDLFDCMISIKILRFLDKTEYNANIRLSSDLASSDNSI